MEAERESCKLRLTNELIKSAHSHSMKAYNHNKDYIIHTSKKGSLEVSIIAFKGSLKVDDFYQNDHFGDTDVDRTLFPSLQRIAEGQPAKVNASLLQKFQDLLNKSELKAEVETMVKKNKKILFTGHSTGGAMASLVTLWMLDEYTRKQKNKLSTFGCVTFGSPLIGDATLTHAVQREKWAGYFTHFVMERDIVPRMMLAPKTSIQEHLPKILTFFQQKVNSLITKKSYNPFNTRTRDGTVDQDQISQQAGVFFEDVLISASTVATHDAYDLMESTNSLKEKLSVDFVEVSPYRPFGVFVFCTRGEDSSSPRQQLVVANPNAALQLLFYFLQLSDEDQDLAQFAVESLKEHFGYEEELNKNGLQLEQRVNLQDLNEDLWTSNETTSARVRTSNKALFELTPSAKWCLLAVEEDKKRKKKNENEVKESMRKYKLNETETKNKKPKIIEDLLDEILKYKDKHGDGPNDYYEAFKLQNDLQDDFEANVNRLEQAKIWDVIVEMLKRKDLPDEFEVWDEFVELGTRFRRVYEPLDIANYYRHSKGEDTGAKYLAVRPKRYKFTQRCYEHANVTGFELVCESNFVAEVEELMNEVIKPKNKTIEQVKNDLESIKNKVKSWKSDAKIETKDVFWGDSILSKLEEKLAEANEI